MKKILIPLLLAMVFGVQAQQFEHFTPKYNPLCSHARVIVKDLNWKNPRQVTFERCPSWEHAEEENICVDVDDNPNYIRCYHSEYLEAKHVHGKMVRVCHVVQTGRSVDLLCTDPKRYYDNSLKYGKCTNFSECGQ